MCPNCSGNFRDGQHEHEKKFKISEISIVPRKLKNDLFFQETYHTQNIRFETLKSRFKKKLSVFPHLILCESYKQLEVCYCQIHALPNELIYNRILKLLGIVF